MKGQLLINIDVNNANLLLSQQWHIGTKKKNPSALDTLQVQQWMTIGQHAKPFVGDARQERDGN